MNINSNLSKSTTITLGVSYINLLVNQSIILPLSDCSRLIRTFRPEFNQTEYSLSKLSHCIYNFLDYTIRHNEEDTKRFDIYIASSIDNIDKSK